MSSWDDLLAASSQEESRELYRRMVSLEALSTFAFQGSRWLADVAPQLLDQQLAICVSDAKLKAARRVLLEKRITNEMLYVKGWPTRMLSDHEAAILADVRIEVSKLIGLDSKYLDVSSIHCRYAELMAINEARK